MGNNTSDQAGYLTPTDGTPPLYGDALIDLFGDFLSGLTAIPRDTNIIPAWSEEPPSIPAGDWAAIAVTVADGNPYAQNVHNPGDGTIAGFQGSDTVTRQEELALECSFYGPNAYANMALFRDGMGVMQNLDTLRAAGIVLISCGSAQAVPSLVKEKWLNRIVITARFRRGVSRTYSILDILSAGGTVTLDKTGTDDIEVIFDADKPQT